MKLAQQGAPEGTVVIAEQQLRGRGRGGRSWHSPTGVGIYCSIVLRPKLLPAKVQLMTLMTAVAVVRAMSLKTGLSPRIKWPNDILINDKKVAGILLETKISHTRVEHGVIGVGINVNQTLADLPEELRLGASSLRMELGRSVERSALVSQVFAELESLYERVQQGDSSVVLEQWRYYSATLGQQVRAVQRDELIEGVAVDVSDDGALLVRVKDDSLAEVLAGDVEHLRIA
jgi:BirA family biotin operon repressor/biotin-[acetyl-CoA-carboxylase] ligase